MGLLDGGPPPVRFRVEGDSMAPTLRAGEWVLALPPGFPWGGLRRGDVVVLRQPEPPWGWIVKRLAGMPGEEMVQDGPRLYADDRLLAELPPTATPPPGAPRREWWNGPDEYFVLGDNPAHSRDSRAFGPVGGERILGRVRLRVWPPGAWGRVG